MAIVTFGFISVLVTYKDGSEEEHEISDKDFIVVDGNQPERDEAGVWKCGTLFKAFRKGYNVVAVVNYTAGERLFAGLAQSLGRAMILIAKLMQRTLSRTG
ncbi:hypothetical protein [Variovorax sp. HJSM1_2]|uniref:hypothetical protein n=1 Tax=Variovorax sp. HJSM1_2 TaxID=3366263 RepID=UPI003BCAA78C